MLRPHHPNEEDNPSSGYSEREVEDYTEHSSGQRATASSVSIGKYIHAVILMCGLMLMINANSTVKHADTTPAGVSAEWYTSLYASLVNGCSWKI